VNSTLAVVALASIAAGGAAYVFIYPLLSGEAKAEKRQKALVGSIPEHRIDRTASSRREQVAQSLKDIETREKARNKLTLEMRITQAGLSWSKVRFYLASGLVGLAFALVLFTMSLNLLLAAGGLFVGAMGVPLWSLSFLKKRRMKRFTDELPNAMDVIVRGIRSGLPLGDCIRIIANEAQEPVKSEFKAIVDAQTLGISIGDAVAKLYERMPVAEANFFGIVIGIQQKSGGNLSEALGNLSRVLRERRKMTGKIKAMSMEAKASAAIIAALPFVVAFLTYLSSPTYIELLWTTQTGKMAMAASGVWMLIGIGVMRKMINFDF
jgi:tight adherence protein B